MNKYLETVTQYGTKIKEITKETEKKVSKLEKKIEELQTEKERLIKESETQVKIFAESLSLWILEAQGKEDSDNVVTSHTLDNKGTLHD